MTALLRSVNAPPTPETFDLWAGVYDGQPNAFFSLEERIVSGLLQDLTGKQVLDAGCGTGRLFTRLQSANAKHIIGIDSSPEMCARAAALDIAEVLVATCATLPIATASIDYVLSSFVVSYIEDLAAFASELRRVARPGAAVLLVDLHPQTARECDWKRSFRVGNQEVDLAWYSRSIDQIITAFSEHGWSLSTRIEAPFATLEQASFERAGRGSYFLTLGEKPALMVLGFSLSEDAARATCAFTGAQCALSIADKAAQTIVIAGTKIANIHRPQAAHAAPAEIDLSGYLLMPGLVNAHDHLDFALYPRLGTGPYGNATEWARDIHHKNADTIALHRSVARPVRVFWGGLRNLLCGVTTVCHHDPLSSEMLSDNFPVRVVQQMRWAHSLAMDEELAAKSQSGDVQLPFIIHAAEGVDPSSATEFSQLEQQGVLNGSTVLVHGLHISRSELRQLNRSGTGLVCCPSSNDFLFGRTHTHAFLTHVQALALGSDSPLTAAGDLLDEVRFTSAHIGMSAAQLYSMVTTVPASLLKLRGGEGRIRPGGLANLVATRDIGLGPAATLVQMSWCDVELVVRSGRVFLASETMYARLAAAMREGLECLMVEDVLRWVRAPLGRLFRDAAAIMRDGQLSLGGKRVRFADAG